MSKSETYPGGYEALMHRVQVRRTPLELADGEALPPMDVDLQEMRGLPTIIEPKVTDSTFERKKRSLQNEFEGHPELCFLNGFLIANLRKNAWPDDTPALFQRLWAEQGDFLIEKLPLRWLVSSIMTFGDHGANEAQRTIGRSLTLLFGMIKLYEFERLYSGTPPEIAHSTESKVNVKLPLDIPSYSLKGGGLDVALLTRLWKDSADDPVTMPLARHLLTAINEDPGTLFRRISEMAEERVEKLEKKKENRIPVSDDLVNDDPDMIEWAVVTTLNENTTNSLQFAAHHLDLGADLVVMFAENESDAPPELREHPQVSVIDARNILAPEDYVKTKRKRNARKAVYFNWARRKLKFDWMAMLDTDEFLVSDRAIPEVLAQTPKDDAFLHLPVYEGFAESDNLYRAPASAHALAPQDVHKLYPVFGAYTKELVLGQADPRVFLRSQLPDIRVGNFIVKYQSTAGTNAHQSTDIWVAHRHAKDFDEFSAALPRRLKEGYARRAAGAGAIKTILDAFEDGDKDAELRSFFDEIALPRPEVIEALDSLGAIKRLDLDLESKCQVMLEEIQE